MDRAGNVSAGGPMNAASTVGSPVEFRQVLGIRFFVGEARRAIDLLRTGGLLVVPAAPALANLSVDIAYREALLGADLVITDSSLMVMEYPARRQHSAAVRTRVPCRTADKFGFSRSRSAILDHGQSC